MSAKPKLRCPHCFSKDVSLEKANDQTLHVTGDRYRCKNCGKFWHQLRLPLDEAGYRRGGTYAR